MGGFCPICKIYWGGFCPRQQKRVGGILSGGDFVLHSNQVEECQIHAKTVIMGLTHMSHLVGKPTMWFPNRFDTNWPVQAQKRARSLKFRIFKKVEEELYYPISENKGADQLRGYRKADLRLCFCQCRLLVLP